MFPLWMAFWIAFGLLDTRILTDPAPTGYKGERTSSSRILVVARIAQILPPAPGSHDSKRLSRPAPNTENKKRATRAFDIFVACGM
jgi:hypothetical protein